MTQVYHIGHAGHAQQEERVPYPVEDDLEQMIIRNPQMITGGDRADVEVIGSQIHLNGGSLRIDVLLLERTGDLTVVEAKLARNGESRREIFAQAMDYASALAEFRLDDLDAALGGRISLALDRLCPDDNELLDQLEATTALKLRSGDVKVHLALDEEVRDLSRIVNYARRRGLSIGYTWFPRTANGTDGFIPAGHPGLSGDYSEPRRLPDTNAITFIQKPGLQYHTSAIFPTYLPSNATANLVFYLDAGNPASYSGSGSTWNDLAGSGLTTELFGSPDYISANGGYLSFTPPSQYGQTSASLSALTTFTVEVWHYFDGTYTGGQPCILTEVFTGPMNFFLGSLDGATAPQLQFGYFPNAWNITQPPYTIPANGWYHIVGTYDGTSVKLYMNNVLIRSNDYNTTPSSSGGGIRFMRRWDNPDYWGGGLAIVRIYSGGLTANQVTANFNSDKGRFGLS